MSGTAREGFTLLIWQRGGEHGRLALIPDAGLDAEDRALLRAADGRWGNVDEGGAASDAARAAIAALHAAFVGDPKDLDEDHPEGSRWAMRFAECIVGSGPLHRTISHVYRTGYL